MLLLAVQQLRALQNTGGTWLGQDSILTEALSGAGAAAGTLATKRKEEAVSKGHQQGARTAGGNPVTRAEPSELQGGGNTSRWDMISQNQFFL